MPETAPSRAGSSRTSEVGTAVPGSPPPGNASGTSSLSGSTPEDRAVHEPAWYVYGVCRGLPADRLAEVRGMAGAPVRLVEEGGLCAVVSPVDLGEFGEDPLRRNLESLEWLEATARVHHGVVDAVAASAPVVPLGLATVYRSRDRVRAALRARSAEFAAALDRVGGRTEWGVKVYADPPERQARVAEAPASDSPGRSYLRRRQQERNTEREGRRAVLRIAEEIDARLLDLAVDGRRHRPQDPGLSGDRGWMVLNAAYLVDDGAGADFRSAVAALAERLAGGRPPVRLRLTGPWAPYSFAVDADADADAEEEP